MHAHKVVVGEVRPVDGELEHEEGIGELANELVRINAAQQVEPRGEHERLLDVPHSLVHIQDVDAGRGARAHNIGLGDDPPKECRLRMGLAAGRGLEILAVARVVEPHLVCHGHKAAHLLRVRFVVVLEAARELKIRPQAHAHARLVDGAAAQGIDNVERPLHRPIRKLVDHGVGRDVDVGQWEGGVPVSAAEGCGEVVDGGVDLRKEQMVWGVRLS